MSIIRSMLRPLSSFTDVSDPQAWLMNTGYGRKTISGENVNPATALTLSTWFACIRCIAEDVGKLPFNLFARQRINGKKQLVDHAIGALLDSSPNPECTAQTFRETLTGWALGWGNGYAEIERDGAGMPIALWPIHPARVSVRRVGGQVEYDIYSPEWGPGTPVALEQRDVFHLRGFGDDPLCGLSIARMAAESIGLSLAAQTFGSAFFGNGATLGLVLEHPGVLKEDAQVRLRASWAKAHSGPENAHKVAVLEEGMKATKIGVPPEDAQFIETRTFQISEIARWFRMPPHKIQEIVRGTFGSLEQQSTEYVVDTLTPWLRRWETQTEWKLLDQRDRATYVARHNVTALLRGDSAARSSYYRTMITAGVMTLNEAREMEDLNPVSPEIGDQLFMQGAMSTVERIVEGPPPAPAPGAVDPGTPSDQPDAKDEGQQEAQDETKQAAAALMPVFTDAEQRCRRKEEMAIANAVRKHGAGSASFRSWATGFFADHRIYLAEAFKPACISLASGIVARRPDYHADIDALNECIAQYCVNAAAAVAATGTPFTPVEPLATTIGHILTLEQSHV